MEMTVDLNCDCGEGAGHDAELMPLISSANIACGAHAGDAATMQATIALAQAHGVGIGAHPGFADREHFGRRELPVSAWAAGALVVRQTLQLREIAREAGAEVRHVKLHGALYNMAARDRTLAEGIMTALATLDWRPAVVVLAGSVLETVARARGDFPVVAEVFADRTYQADGSLTPRARGGALITDEAQAAAQVLRMVREGVVPTVDGREVPVRADTVCLHGDGPHAVAFARRLRAELARAGIAVRAFSA
jgi:UPF0271 protein